MNLFDLSLRLNGFPIGDAKQSLKQIQSVPENEFEKLQWDRGMNIVDFHCRENAFYQGLMKRKQINDWNDIPVMSKQDLQIPLKGRLSKSFRLKDVYINKTSGSSGDPFIFAKDKFCHALTWAVIQDRLGWYDLDINRSLQARFYGIPLDKKGYYKERFKDYLGKRVRFSVFDLSEPALEKVLASFKKNRFEYLNGYTSSIVQFAKFLNKKQIFLKDVCPTLKCCLVTSEMLFNDDKALMERQFGIPVINEYGASELDLIAFENLNGEWQVNSETLFVEILNDDNKPVPYGKEGRIVITSFYNKAHPFIRYDIGDIGFLSEESTSKNPILKKLIGRTNDMALLPSGKKAAGLTFYYITKSIMEDDGNVKEFIIEQLAPDSFKILYVSKEGLSKNHMEKIETEMTNYLEPGLQVIFERKERLIRSKSGKLKQFSSFVKDTP